MIELQIINFKFVPNEFKTLFPNPVDGFLYLEPCNNGYYMFRRIFGDSHLWKERNSADHFVKKISQIEKDDLTEKVSKWNDEAKKDIELKLKKVQEHELWISNLPEKIASFFSKW